MRLRAAITPVTRRGPARPATSSTASSTWSHRRSSAARSCTSTAARHRPPTSRPSTGQDTRGCRSTLRGQGGDLRRADRLPRLGTPPCPRTVAGRWAPPAPSGHLLSPAPRSSLLNKLQVNSSPGAAGGHQVPLDVCRDTACRTRAFVRVARVPSRDARRSGRSNPSPGHRGCGGALATTTTTVRPVDSVKHSPCGPLSEPGRIAR